MTSEWNRQLIGRQRKGGQNGLELTEKTSHRGRNLTEPSGMSGGWRVIIVILLI